jgi:hypothetical protein
MQDVNAQPLPGEAADLAEPLFRRFVHWLLGRLRGRICGAESHPRLNHLIARSRRQAGEQAKADWP